MPTPTPNPSPNNYHQPVMLQQAIQALHIQPKGIYVDLTFGGGSYTKAILNTLTPAGRLFAFDQDQDTLPQANTLQDPRLTFIQSNFRFLKPFLTSHHIHQVDGIVADLGTSSHQLNTPHRGFAARLPGPLDMRMNQQKTLTAAHIINTYPQKKLINLFKTYGEIKNAHQLTNTIIQTRKHHNLTTTSQLKQSIQTCTPKKQPYKYYAKIFQALRIEVNDELTSLQEMLTQSVDILKPQARLVIISYHSLEDRLVKKFIKTGNFQGRITQDIYGHLIRPLDPLHNKPIQPHREEINRNNRSRSAKLRIAAKRNTTNHHPNTT